jgi:hypothetical protein
LLDILTMHGPINVKSPNNISKWQMGFNSAFKGLIKFIFGRKRIDYKEKHRNYFSIVKIA